MRTLQSFLSLWIAAGLAGCAHNVVSFREVPPAQPTAEKALVYVYFIGDGLWRGRPSFSVDGRIIATVGQSEFSWCHLDPGNHTFRAEWSLLEKPRLEGGQFEPKELKLILEPKKTYYVHYIVREDGAPTTILETAGGLVGKALSKSHVTSVALIADHEAEGLELLGRCYFRPSNFGN